MKYVHLEENTNKILGWYDDSINPKIPTPNIEVSEKIWQEAININANCYEEGKFIIKDFRSDKEIEQQELQIKINEALAYLNKTNHKIFAGYIPKENEDLKAIQAKRDEALLFIRENK